MGKFFSRLVRQKMFTSIEVSSSIQIRAYSTYELAITILASGDSPALTPFEGVLTTPISRHRYLYANNNPITFYDPSGAISITANRPAADSIFAILQRVNWDRALGIGAGILASLRKGFIRWKGTSRSFGADLPSLNDSTGVFASAEVTVVDATSECSAGPFLVTPPQQVSARYLLATVGASIPLEGSAGPSVTLDTEGEFEAFTQSILGPNPLLLIPFTVMLDVNTSAAGGGQIVSFFMGVGAATIAAPSSAIPAVSASISGGVSLPIKKPTSHPC